MQSELANGIEYAFPAREKYSGIFWQNAEGPGKWASGKTFWKIERPLGEHKF